MEYTSVGRETLEAITAELVQEPAPRRRLESGPEIVIGQSAIGRETLAAIEAELAPPRIANPRRRSSRPEALSPTPTARGHLSAPAPRALEDTFEEEEITLPRASGHAEEQLGVELEILEMHTFLVRSAQGVDLSTDTRRRDFVDRHLRHALRNPAPDAVVNVEVSPGPNPAISILRVWCRVRGVASDQDKGHRKERGTIVER